MSFYNINLLFYRVVDSSTTLFLWENNTINNKGHEKQPHRGQSEQLNRKGFIMKIEELIEVLKLNEEQAELVKKFQQSTEDVIRTDYSRQLKAVNDELVQYKPIEKSATEIELEQLKKELAETKFQKSLKDIGVKDDFTKYLKQDIDVEEFKEFYEQFKGANGLKDFVPNSKNMGDSGITKEEFKKMGISERTKLYESSPELYDQLSK